MATTTTTTYAYRTQNNSSQRALAMVLALASALVLSPLYVSKHKNEVYTRYDTRWRNSGFVLPMLLAGLIIAIRTTSSSSSSSSSSSPLLMQSPSSSESPSWVLRIGSSSWGLAGVLVMLMLVLSCQDSLHHFFWR